ncbi:hypothetical protein ANCDUO_11713 [Ancylostoma duodenale]|uniref:Uncharacterized protein n=1 Tax=Ancylostoma duodenale TaxID=51022 RepID=A0A0C2GAR8_9BILA|nr:hypothetical protein ANCDUO_11713 [Ancylostoma duodenale]
MERGASQSSPNNLVSRILQVALGLFVTTSDLPPYPANHEYLSYDCSFDSDCRYQLEFEKQIHGQTAYFQMGLGRWHYGSLEDR